jgi:transposase
MKQAIYVGVDVSKKRLDVPIRPLGQVFGVSNDRKGISQLAKRLKKLQPVCIAIDATGGLEKELAYALAAANLPVAVVNPRQVSNFAKSTGQRAKTDAINAGVLAHFAEVMKPEVRQLPDAASGTLRVGDASSTVGRDDDRRIQPTGSRVKIGSQIDQFIAAVAERPTCVSRPRDP